MTLPFETTTDNDPFSFLRYQLPIYQWRGGTDIAAFLNASLIQRPEQSVFVFDFSSEAPGRIPVEAFVQDLVIAAISRPEHLFFVLAEPKLLANAFQAFFARTDFKELAQSKREASDPPFAGPVYRRILKHIFVGSKFNSDDNFSLEHNLPWLMAVSFLRTFIYADGQLDEDLNLEDLRPWTGDTPDHGDFDLFAGVSYEVGSYRYRDSDNAFRKAFRPLSLAIFDLKDELDDEQARHLLSQADCASQKGVPNLLLSGGRHQALRQQEDQHRYEVDEILSFLQRDQYLL
jgi:hypothetical protein